jgi:hypothetical protein
MYIINNKLYNINEYNLLFIKKIINNYKINKIMYIILLIFNVLY